MKKVRGRGDEGMSTCQEGRELEVKSRQLWFDWVFCAEGRWPCLMLVCGDGFGLDGRQAGGVVD